MMFAATMMMVFAMLSAVKYSEPMLMMTCSYRLQDRLRVVCWMKRWVASSYQLSDELKMRGVSRVGSEVQEVAELER